MGLVESAAYTSAGAKLMPGDRLLLMTDGVTEAENEGGEAFGDDWLEAMAADTSLAAMLDRVAGFMGACEARDDCTLLQIQYLG